MKLKILILAGLIAGASVLSSFAQALGCANPPVASVAPLNQFTTAGANVQFTAIVAPGTGTAPFSMYWVGPDFQLIGVGPVITLFDVQPEDEGLYFLMLWDGIGCSSLTAGKLFVRVLPNAFSPEFWNQ